MHRHRQGAALAIVALALHGCAPELPAPRERDVAQALAKDFLAPLGALVISRPSDCGSDGETAAALPASLFAAFLATNAADGGLDFGSDTVRLRIDDSGIPPRRLRAEHRAPVVAVSRIGIDGDRALACVEVYGVQERGFFLLLRRDHTSVWTLKSEIEAWRNDERQPPEELPDGSSFAPISAEGVNASLCRLR